MKRFLLLAVLLLSLMVVSPVMSSGYSPVEFIRDDVPPVYDVVVFAEDFTDNSRDWETASGDGSRYLSILDSERYLMNLSLGIDYYEDLAGGVDWWVVGPGFTDWTLAPILGESFMMEVEVYDLETDTGNYGVTAIFNLQADYEQYLLFTANSDGTWLLNDKRSAVWQEGELSGMPFDFMDGEMHTIGVWVDMEMETYSLLVDGYIVASVPAVEYMPGSIGFGLQSYPGEELVELSAQFDNLEVRVPGTGGY